MQNTVKVKKYLNLHSKNIVKVTFLAFCYEVSSVKFWSHRSHKKNLVSLDPKSIYIYIERERESERERERERAREMRVQMKALLSLRT